MGVGTKEKNVVDDDDDVSPPPRRTMGRSVKFCSVLSDDSSSGSDDDSEEIINIDDVKEVPDAEVRFWKIKCKVVKGDSFLGYGDVIRSIRNKAKENNIKCAMHIPFLSYVFVEAKCEANVKELCRSLKHLLNVASVSPMSKHDMEKILRPDNDLRVGDYVIYNGDLAKLVKMNPLKGTALLKTIPRLSLEELKPGGQKRGRRSRVEIELPQRFITLEELEEFFKGSGIEVKRKRDAQNNMLYMVGGYKFMDGYRLQEVSINTLRKASPRPEEIRKYEGGGHERKTTRFLELFEKGDKVKVVEGDHAGKIAIFVRMNGPTVYLLIDGNEWGMHRSKIRRHFEEGSRVCIARGEHEGTSGIVTFVAEGYIQIVNDAHETLDVPIDCVGGSSFIPEALNTIGNYGLYDLVLLADRQTFGMIIRIDKTQVEILKGTPEKVDVITARPMEIYKKFLPAGGSVAQDCAKNDIRLNDVVRVQNGYLQGKEGAVKHIMGGVLFVHDPKYVNCGGLFSVSASACFKLGGLNKPGEEPSSAIAKVKPRRHPLDRKKVMITRGRFKSYLGRVMRVFNAVAHIFLDARLRTISVRIQHLKNLEPDEVRPKGRGMKPPVGNTAGWDGDTGAEKVDAGWDDAGTAAAAAENGWGNTGGSAGGGDEGWGDQGGGEVKAMEIDGGWGDQNAGGCEAMEVDDVNVGGNSGSPCRV